jgi:hypothetical protein
LLTAAHVFLCFTRIKPKNEFLLFCCITLHFNTLTFLRYAFDAMYI